MGNEISELLKKALTLSVEERAELASSLLDSLDDSNDSSVEVAWDAEIMRRMADIDSGAVVPISFEVARRKLTSSLE